MIEISISPVAFRLGPMAFTWYGIMIVLAILAVVLLSLREAPRYGIRRDYMYGLALWAILAGLAGAKLVHVIDYRDVYFQDPAAMLSPGGFGVYGAILGAAAGTAIYAWRRKLSFWALGDAIAPGAVLGQAIGRVGCTFNGCCYGSETHLPWAFIWTGPGTFAPIGTPVHPTQVYLLFWNLAVLGILWQLRSRLAPRGSLFLAYLAFYSLGDFLIRFFREGDASIGSLLQAQVIGITMFSAAVVTLAVRIALSRARASLPRPKQPGPGPAS